MNSNDEIINILIKACSENDISQNELARRVGMAKSAISRYFNKTREFPLNRSEQFAKALGIETADLIGVALPENNPANNPVNNHNEYKMFPVSISAGCLEDIEAIDTYDIVTIADEIMGKYAGRKGIILLKVNGESMNNVIPDGSYIVVDTSKTQVSDIIDRDIVVFSENGSYSVKRYVNDIANERFLFKPDSTDDTFTAIEVKYENSSNLKLIGKVVKYIVNLD